MLIPIAKPCNSTRFDQGIPRALPGSGLGKSGATCMDWKPPFMIIWVYTCVYCILDKHGHIYTSMMMNHQCLGSCFAHILGLKPYLSTQSWLAINFDNQKIRYFRDFRAESYISHSHHVLFKPMFHWQKSPGTIGFKAPINHIINQSVPHQILASLTVTWGNFGQNQWAQMNQACRLSYKQEPFAGARIADNSSNYGTHHDESMVIARDTWWFPFRHRVHP